METSVKVNQSILTDHEIEATDMSTLLKIKPLPKNFITGGYFILIPKYG